MKCNDESLFVNKKQIGIAISILGSILIVIHAPKRNTVNTFDDLRLHLESPEFISFVFLLGLSGTLYAYFTMLPQIENIDSILLCP